jgi:hypothetical protein
VAKVIPTILLDPVVSEPEPALTPEQQEPVNSALNRESVVLTGPAGCGKSVIVRVIKAAFETRHQQYHTALQDPGRRSAAEHEGPWRLAVTASTGIAAM